MVSGLACGCDPEPEADAGPGVVDAGPAADAGSDAGIDAGAVTDAGLCEAAACDDGDPCTEDTCGSAGCAHAPAPDGTICDLGTCVAGTCTADSPVVPTQDGCSLYEANPPAGEYRMLAYTSTDRWLVSLRSLLRQRGSGPYAHDRPIEPEVEYLGVYALGETVVAAFDHRPRERSGARPLELAQRSAAGSWSDLTLPLAFTSYASLAAGHGRLAVANNTMFAVWDGSAWASVAPIPHRVGGGMPLPGVSRRLGVSSSAVYVIAEEYVDRWDGTAWTSYQVPSGILPTPPVPTSLAVGSEAEIFVVADAELYRFDGSALVTAALPAGCTEVRDVRGATNLVVGRFVCAGREELYLRTGGSWSAAPAPAVDDPARAIIGLGSSGQVALEGDNGGEASIAIEELAGGSWSTLPWNPRFPFETARGPSLSQLYAGGIGLHHFNGAGWDYIDGTDNGSRVREPSVMGDGSVVFAQQQPDDRYRLMRYEPGAGVTPAVPGDYYAIYRTVARPDGDVLFSTRDLGGSPETWFRLSGTTLHPFPSPTGCIRHLGWVALSQADRVVAQNCVNDISTVDRVWVFDGSAWTMGSNPYPPARGVLARVGTQTSPVAMIWHGQDYRALLPAGWMSGTLAAPPSGSEWGYIAGTSHTDLVYGAWPHGLTWDTPSGRRDIQNGLTWRVSGEPWVDANTVVVNGTTPLVAGSLVCAR